MENNGRKNDLPRLSLMTFEGISTEEGISSLEQLLKDDPSKIDDYLEMAVLYSVLKEPEGLFNKSHLVNANIEDGSIDVGLWKMLADYEKTAPSIEIEEPVAETVPMKMLKIEKTPWKIQKSSLYSVIVSAAAILLLALLVTLKPVLPTVAQLTDSMDAEWEDTQYSLTNGDVLRQGQLILAKGLAEITFDDGAVVIIEAPAVFELESPKSMYLDSGKLSAYVPRRATGFTVNMPSASVVDIGTEFGIDVQFDGTCDLHMFTGKANLIIGQEGEDKASQIVSVNEAKNVDGRTGRVRDIALQDNRFVRRFDSMTGLVWKGQDFDLADVVGGGNGFGTGDWKIGLSPLTGEFIATVSRSAFIHETRGYVEVRKSSFIDGVFIPDGEEGDVIVSSRGHLFEGCPDTVDTGRTYDSIRTGGRIWTFNSLSDYRELMLDGVHYDGKNNSAIFLHPNAGLTFDLQAIREHLPEGARIQRFTALCGISDDTPGTEQHKSDFWVLVDGQRKFELPGVTKDASGQKVDVLIKPEDRFLTLVTTDGGENTENDYCLFARPVLELDK